MLGATEECSNPTVTEEAKYNSDGKCPLASISRLCAALLPIRVRQHTSDSPLDGLFFSKSTFCRDSREAALSRLCF